MKYLYIILAFFFVTGCAYKEVTIDGTVKLKGATNTISGVKVKSGKVWTLTASGGGFSLQGEVVESGNITLFFTKQGYKDHQEIVLIKTQDENSDTLGPSAGKITVEMTTNE